MRFQLSTMMLSTALLAVSLGWYLDRNLRFSKELIGTWFVNNQGLRPYSSTLTFDDDGQFTKQEIYRECVATFRGRWSSDPLGNLTIHLTSAVHATDMDGYLGTPAEPETLDMFFHFQWNHDRPGLLQMTSTSPLQNSLPPDPRWDRTYQRTAMR